MNILIISHWDFMDHGMPVTKKTPVHFAEHGHHVTFMTHSEMTQMPAPLTNLHPNLDVRRFDLPLKWLAIPKIRRVRQLLFFAWYSFLATRRLMRSGRRPDVIYAAECDAILIGRVLAWIYRVPFITRYYGISTQLMQRPWRHLLYAVCLRAPADLAIVTDDGTGGLEALQRVNRRIGRICFWENGIDPPVVDSANAARLNAICRTNPDQVVLMTVSRLYGWKRIDRAIRALARIRKENELPLRLVIVGHGPEQENLQKLAGQLGVADQVVILGAVPREQIHDAYANADVFLGLSDMSNVGNSLWEAMSAGLCVIALDTGDTNKVIQDGINGRLVSVQRGEEALIGDLATAIRQMATEQDERHRLGTSARDHIRTHLKSWNERLHQELTVIRELVDGKTEPTGTAEAASKQEAQECIEN